MIYLVVCVNAFVINIFRIILPKRKVEILEVRCIFSSDRSFKINKNGWKHYVNLLAQKKQE